MIIKTATVTDSSTNWNGFYSYIEKNKEYSPCLHENCPQCNGTGQRLDGLGNCIHMISCPCPKCSPR